KNPVTLALIARVFSCFGDLTRRHRAHVIPMIVAIDEPAKTDRRAVEQILAPEILHAVDRDAALHRADDGHLSFRHVAGRAEWNERLERRRLECFEKLKLSLIDVEQR